MPRKWGQTNKAGSGLLTPIFLLPLLTKLGLTLPSGTSCRHVEIQLKLCLSVLCSPKRRSARAHPSPPASGLCPGPFPGKPPGQIPAAAVARGSVGRWSWGSCCVPSLQAGIFGEEPPGSSSSSPSGRGAAPCTSIIPAERGQHHRTAGAGRNLWGSPGPTPAEQDHLEHLAQDGIQARFEYLKDNIF